MSTEYTAARTFQDLIRATAAKLGLGYYGANGDEAQGIPVDVHDLDLCKRIVNNGIRMFISNPPPGGWRWLRPVASTTLWPTVTGFTVSASAYDAPTDETILTASDSVFHESMEEKNITVTGTGDIPIKRYSSATQIAVAGDYSSIVGSQAATVTADGNYTLPRGFAGSFAGGLTFASGTNRAVPIAWYDSARIRQMRENESQVDGTPFALGLDVFAPASGRRRYHLMAYPRPSETIVVQFPYDLHFDHLTELNEYHPAPVIHDETIRAACLAVAERDVEDRMDGPMMQYYQSICLPNSHQLDARSAPRRLGYFGNPRGGVSSGHFREFIERPNVTFVP